MYLNRNLIAIDVGSRAIKVIDYSGTKDRIISAIGQEPIPYQAMRDGTIVDFTTIQASLKDLLRRLRLSTRGRRAAISLGGSSVLIKKVFFPNGDDLELASLIENEAEQYLQYDLNDLYISWHLFPPTKSEDRAALIVGARKSLVEQHIALVKAVGLKLGVIDCSVFCLSNIFEQNYGFIPKLSLLVSVGASATLVVFVCRGLHLYDREIPFGGEKYTALIMDQLSLSFDDAESLKAKLATDNGTSATQVKEMIQNLHEQLASEIQTTIDYFLQNEDVHHEFEGVQQIYLSGGASFTYGLEKSLSSSLSIPIERLNPLKNISLKSSVEGTLNKSQIPSFSIASGLALRQFEDQ